MESKTVTRIWHRIYSDYFMPSRLEEYQLLLEEALNNGYEFHSISSFWDIIKKENIDSEVCYLILRHDIDYDIRTAKLMWNIEQKLGVSGSYYFRLSTIDIDFMTAINEKGGEAGYHFEELATVAKREGLVTSEQVQLEMQHIMTEFKLNLNRIRKETCLPMTIVASHGDFANRKLGITNCLILDDLEFRKQQNIQLEVYDDEFMKYVNTRCSDTHYPKYWEPFSPSEAIKSRRNVVYILVHPSNWSTNRYENSLDNIKRLKDGIFYSIRKFLPK